MSQLYQKPILKNIISLWPNGLYCTRLLCPWNFPSKNTGVGCHFLLQGSFWPTDRTWASCVSCICRQILYQWAPRKQYTLASILNLEFYFKVKNFIHSYNIFFVDTSLSVQFSRSVVSNSATPWIAAHQASLSITNSWSLPKPMSI